MIDNNEKLYRIYSYLVIIFGVLFIYFTPPMQSPDENTHFYNSYSISTGNVLSDIDGNTFGRRMPVDFIEFVNSYDQYLTQYSNKINLETIMYDTTKKENILETEFVQYWNADTHPLAYMAPAFGMCVLRFVPGLQKSPYNFLMAGRFANLLLFLVLTTATLKVTPIFKKTFALVFLLPSTLSLASSLSYDTLIITVTCFLLAHVFRLIQDDKMVSMKDIIIICITLCVLVCVKQAYFPLALILFSIPRERFGTKRKYFAIVFLALIVAFGIYLPFLVINNNLLGNIKLAIYEYNSQSVQIDWLRSHLSFIPSIIGNSFKIYGDFYFNSFFGNLGKLSIYFAPIIAYLYSILIIICAFDESRVNKGLPLKLKILSVLGIVSSIILIFVGTYIIWTSHTVGIGATYVDGVQGRYFIMLVPYIAMLFTHKEGKKIKYGEKTMPHYFDLCIVYSMASLIIAVSMMIIRYWN